MKVEVDRDACQAYGICALTAPEVFGSDDDGYALTLIEGELPAEREDDASEAVRSCPVQALLTG
jgi:ferredoxin